MKLVFFSNQLNIHQVCVADELYNLLGDNFRFVATLPSNKNSAKGGLDFSNRSYCIMAEENLNLKNLALQISVESDVCVFGASSQQYAVERAKKNPKAISFEISERWLKKGFINIFSPNLIRWRYNYSRYYKKANFYKLCASSYTAKDDELLFAYKNRHFKWGYFTKVSDFDLETSLDVSRRGRATILWCARFLSLKHPELPVLLAKKLKDNGYEFHIDMIGTGVKFDDTVNLARFYDVEDVVSFLGNMPNEEVLKQMRQHNIFLFTSDQNEGWGAVLNESMSNACVPIAFSKIGSARYLIKDGVNGLLYGSNVVDSLYNKIIQLMDNPTLLKEMQCQAYNTMHNHWSPKNAVCNLLQLIDDLQHNCKPSIQNGPCSIA